MEELLEKFTKYIRKSKSITISKASKDLGISELDIYGLVTLAKNDGLLIDIIDDKIVKVQKIVEQDTYKIPSNLKQLKLLLISDTHLASTYDRLDLLNYIYKEAENKKVNYILHSGDIVDGRSNRPDQIYSLREASYDGQRDYVIKNYPHSKIPTIIIPGNHDLWWVKACGSNIVKDIGKQRPDLICLDTDCEDVMIGDIKIRMYHGSGGGSYAKSYKLQKYLDRIPTEDLPDILQTGHIHQAFYMKQGKTHCFQTGCLQDLTPFERSMGFSNDKSCWWVTLYLDSNGRPLKVEQELESFPDDKKRVRKL